MEWDPYAPTCFGLLCMTTLVKWWLWGAGIFPGQTKAREAREQRKLVALRQKEGLPPIGESKEEE
jgi:hypothetical protein